MEARAICRRCVLPDRPPGIRLDGEGVCNLCREHEAAGPAAGAPPVLETDFTRMLAKHRGKGDYDCLVMCSGGKDSTSALYYMKARYGLRPLAFTFDHGFETEDALANVRRAVEKLDIDSMTFRSTFMNDMFARVLESGSRAVLCHLCSIWYMDLTFKMAARFRIPVIIAGWTKGQSTDQGRMSKCACDISAPEFREMGEATVEFLESLRDDPKYGDFPRSMEEVLRRARKRFKTIVLSPHWFLRQHADSYVETIRRELDWEYPRLSYPRKSTNCTLNFLSVHNSMEFYGYTHYHVEMSRQIREGLMTREEALELLEIDLDLDLLNEIARPLGHRFGEAGPEGR
jgi:hypothetical protein